MELRLVPEKEGMKTPCMCAGKLSCLWCGYPIEVFLSAKDELPEELECPICGKVTFIAWCKEKNLRAEFKDIEVKGYLRELKACA